MRLQVDRHVHEHEQVETVGLQIQPDEGNQHQDRAEERIQEELQRRVDAALATPDTDDQEHRDEHRFPEYVEQQAIEGAEHADHQPLEDQERREVLRRAGLDRIPARDHHERRDEGGQQDQRRRQPVDPEVVPDVEGLDPGHAFYELHPRFGIVEADIQANARKERQDGEGERRLAHQPGLRRLDVPAIADQQQDHAARDREPDEETEQVVRQHGPTPPT